MKPVNTDPATSLFPLATARQGRVPLLMLGAAAASTVTFAAPAAAQSQTSGLVEQQGVIAKDASGSTFTFDIPGGSLESVAAAFERITGIRVSLTNPDLGTLPSPGVRGSLSARDALTQALVGTSVRGEFGANGVDLSIATMSETVQVTAGDRPTSVSSPRYTVPLRDIAQTVAIVPRAVIEQRVATTLTDVLRNVPGITLQAGEGGGSSSSAGDMFNMRGFSANNSLFVDNVRDSGLISRDVFNVEQVEVFMGPTGSDVGRGTAAGYVNMQTKRPHLGTSVAVTANAGSAEQGRLTADINLAVPATASSGWLARSAVRLNALWQDRGVPGRDYVSNNSKAFAPSLALGLGTTTRAFASAQIVRQDNLPDYGIPGAAWADAALAPTTIQATRPVRQANYYGSPNFDYDRVEQNSVFGRVEHDVRRNLTLSNQLRYNTSHREAVISAITNPAQYNAETGQVTIARQGNERENKIISNQTNIVTRFETGRVRHGFSGGVEILHENQFSPSLTDLGTRTPNTTDIYNPDPFAPVVGFAPSRTLQNTDGTTNSVALYVNDAAELGQRFLLSGGFRLERYNTDYVAIGADGLVTTDETADGNLFSGRASLLYRLNGAANVYVSYGSTATPPGEANFQLSAAANNVNNPNVDPQISTNLEFGSKMDVNSRLSLNGAVFFTRNKNVIYNIDSTQPIPIFNQDDAQAVNGVSVGALGQITDRWQVLANAAYLDATLDSQGAQNGNRLSLTPAFSGTIWTTVRLYRGLSVGGGVQHVGRSYTSTANTILVPAYSLVDGLVEYAFGRNLTVRLNLYNLTDAVYIRSVNNNGGRYNPGNARSVLLSTSVGF